MGFSYLFLFIYFNILIINFYKLKKLNQNERTVDSGYFKNLKEPLVFIQEHMERTDGYKGGDFLFFPNILRTVVFIISYIVDFM